VELKSGTALLEAQQIWLHPPSCFAPDFSDSDLKTIHAETSEIHERITRLTEN